MVYQDRDTKRGIPNWDSSSKISDLNLTPGRGWDLSSELHELLRHYSPGAIVSRVEAEDIKRMSTDPWEGWQFPIA